MAPQQLESTLLGRLEAAQLITELGTVVICIDRETKVISGFNCPASEMFGFEERAPENIPWWQALGTDKRADNPLHFAVDSGVRTALPPTVLNRRDGGEVVVSGLVTPKFQDGRDTSLLLLRVSANSSILEMAGRITDRDSIAILGVDQIRYGSDWSISDTSRFMMDLRASLMEIVRSEDIVALPTGNCIPIIFGNIGIDESLDVANALLSHLRSVPQFYGHGAGGARFCVGLARTLPDGTALQALVAANNALLCTWQKASSQRIGVSAKWDPNQLCGNNYSAVGVFTEDIRGSDYASLLAQVASLPLQAEKSDKYYADIIGLILERPGVLKLGIFRRCKDGRHVYLVGGRRSGSDICSLTEEDFPADITAAVGSSRPGLSTSESCIPVGRNGMVQPLIFRRTVLGYIAFEFEETEQAGQTRFSFDPGGLHLLAATLPGLKETFDSPDIPGGDANMQLIPLNTGIEGYVVDNMEGAVDQATFLAKIDIPVAIIGPRGTGKMYIAKIVHQESGGAEGMIAQIDCREFRNRQQAVTHIGQLLEQSEGKTLVFKSPHLLAPDAQLKLAKQISSRTLADVRPPRYLPRAKYVALFPDTLDKLIAHSGLTEKLASVFAGFPINVPPVKDRKQAVLRWAHKILSQESAARARPVMGFTPDAEQAMLSHEWPGNISEMRQCIVDALERSNKEWITPVDLGIFKGLSADGSSSSPDPEPFLSALESAEPGEDDYAPTSLEHLDVALGEAVNSVAQEQSSIPLGVWLEDELVLAVTDRYPGDLRRSAEFLFTRPRNISRWMPKIMARQEERNESLLWREPRRFIGEWVRETPYLGKSPQLILQKILLSHVTSQCAGASIATRAKIMGVSVPTYQKRLQESLDHPDRWPG